MRKSATEEACASLPIAIDIVHLNAQTLGDRDLQRELLHLFCAQAPHLLEQMHASHNDEAKRIDDLAHRLKGSASAIGAFGVADAADNIPLQSAVERRRALDNLALVLDKTLADIRFLQKGAAAADAEECGQQGPAPLR